MIRQWSVRVLLVLCAVSVLGTGCRTKKKKGIGMGGTDIMSPTTLGTDLTGSPGGALGDRFEEGTRVTDAGLETVLFDYDSYQVKTAEVPKIEKAAAYMRSNADVRLIAEGHCDERGTREYNMSLGEHRALAVRAYLVGLGIDGARVQTRSYGEERPVEAGHDEAAWRVNRRVEFALFR